jgi:hypothetical protein
MRSFDKRRMTIPNLVIARSNDEAICSNLKLPAYDAGDCFVPRNDDEHPLAVMLNSVQHLLAQHSQAHQEILNYEIIMNTIDKQSLSE